MKKILVFVAVFAVSFMEFFSCKPFGSVGEVMESDGTVSSTFEGCVDYDTYFTTERLRIDLVLAGDAETRCAFLSEIHKECEWAGSPNSLIDKFGYGQYFLEAFSDGKLIFSKGFSSIIEEWRSTPQAKTTPMAVNQTVWMPFPKDRINIVLYQRIGNEGPFTQLFECGIDPSDTHIIQGPDNDYNVKAMQIKGDAAHKVDLVFAGEAYTRDELPKLRNDAERIMECLFSVEPYASRRDDFNVYLIESISEDGRVDDPSHGQWYKTAMESSFDTFYEEGRLAIMDHRKIASVYSGVPFDAMYIIVNEAEYGACGIYGSFSMGTSDNGLSGISVVNEFSRSFAGHSQKGTESAENQESIGAMMDFYVK